MHVARLRKVGGRGGNCDLSDTNFAYRMLHSRRVGEDVFVPIALLLKTRSRNFVFLRVAPRHPVNPIQLPVHPNHLCVRVVLNLKLQVQSLA